MSSRREELEKRNCKFSSHPRLRPIKSAWKNVQRLFHSIFNARCVIGLSVVCAFYSLCDDSPRYRAREKEIWYRFCIEFFYKNVEDIWLLSSI